jgi:urea transport system ATP-binding protein
VITGMTRPDAGTAFYGGSHTLRDLGFEAPAGAYTTLLGRNGVGKTTLLKCLVGLLPVRSGTITWQGRDLSGLSPDARARAGIAYVPQGREIFPRLTVEENLRMGLAALPAGARVPERVFEMFPVRKDMYPRNRAHFGFPTCLSARGDR